MAGSEGDKPAKVVLCAPDSFKGCLTAAEAADAMARGVEAIGSAVQAVRCPVADGGDGTLDALVVAREGTVRRAEVTGPRGETVTARWGWIASDRMAVVELAEASGLTRIGPQHRDPETNGLAGRHGESHQGALARLFLAK